MDFDVPDIFILLEFGPNCLPWCVSDQRCLFFVGRDDTQQVGSKISLALVSLVVRAPCSRSMLVRNCESSRRYHENFQQEIRNKSSLACSRRALDHMDAGIV